jgi:gamma-glutamyltranspeptidase/glutathione hydrolase
MVNVLDFGMTATEAVAAPRFHHQLLPPDLITYTPCCPLPAETVGGLEALGYRVEPHDFVFGEVQLILVTDDGEVRAASEPGFRSASEVAPRRGVEVERTEE